MKINVAFDTATVNEDFIRCVYAARDFLCANFNGGNQFNIQAGLTTMANSPISSLGSSTYFLHNEFTYAQAKTAYQTKAVSVNALSAFNNNWPASDPTSGPGVTWTINQALAKTLGLLAADTLIDGFFGLGPQSFDFTPDNTTQAASGKFKGFAVILHEITEIMGRTQGNLPQIMCAYSASGVKQFSSATNPHYFSINNGATNLRDWNTGPSGDPGDWAGAGGALGDAFNAFTGSGIVQPMDEIDFVNMDILGYGRFTPQNPNHAAIGHGRGSRF